MFAALFSGPPLILHLIKPLFEGVPPERAVDRDALEPALVSVVEAAARARLSLRDLMASPVLGSGGTVEFFGLFGPTDGRAPVGLAPALSEAERVVARARA